MSATPRWSAAESWSTAAAASTSSAEYDAELAQFPTAQRGRRMSRVGPPVRGKSKSGGDSHTRMMETEASNEIKYRTCSWQKTAFLLFSEYICLAIMSFPYSYSILGLVPGIIVTVLTAGFVLYTSLVVWEFCLRHPEVRDVCDIGQMLCGNSRVAWYATAAMFLLNNTFIQALHVVVITRYLNTMTGHSSCTMLFAVIAAAVSWVCSLPRTFSTLSFGAAAVALFTFVGVVLAAAFAGVEGKHGTAGYTPILSHTLPDGTMVAGGDPIVLIVPTAGVAFYTALNAYLNIAYTFIGQITLPSFIAEMKEPKDFPKALWAVTVCEIILFSLVGGVIYAYTGTQYTTAPAFGSIGNIMYKKVSFSFMIPTLVFLGVLYASVSARFLFLGVFEKTQHQTKHTVVGWISWAGILAVTWISALLVAELIPFFSELLSLMSALFDSFFGWLFWGVAYIQMRRADLGPSFYSRRGLRGWTGLVVNMLIIGVGFFFLTAGTYASVRSIINDYTTGTLPKPFACNNNAV